MKGEEMEREENILGTEKIGKLIRKFSIPCIISLLVNFKNFATTRHQKVH